ncbi:MAG: hypothetical protein KDB22_13670 [Planctomycetales bacterium]|nr:hypothetical protein [Planctomycetales bacterium]
MKLVAFGGNVRFSDKSGEFPCQCWMYASESLDGIVQEKPPVSRAVEIAAKTRRRCGSHYL